MDINYTRKSIAHILQKDSLRVEVQLALLLESTNGSVDGFGLLLQNLSTSQHGETIQKVLDWDKTLIEFRVKGAFRDSRLLSYVLARVERADKLAGR
jgi:hypothetical protein